MNLFGYSAASAGVAALAFWAVGQSFLAGAALIVALSGLALFFMTRQTLKSYAFTVWVAAFVAASLLHPELFDRWFGYDLSLLIVPLIQIIMFGMGTTLSLDDFARVVKMPIPVLIGFVGQYSIMPLIGLLLAKLMNFTPETAAGIILVGSCPGGVASNLMAYLAGGNVALSVTMTSCSTLASPIMTPFLMKTLAGKLVPIDFTAMMLSILNMIIVPIVAGLIANKILYSKKTVYSSAPPLAAITAVGIALAILAAWVSPSAYGALSPLRSGLIVGFALIAVVAFAKLFINVLLRGPENWMDKTLPLVSMAGICVIIAIITARSSDKLLSIGPAVILAAMMHNLCGYLLGYRLARILRQNERDSRTIAIEVGLQNAGMASGLAMTVLKSTEAALAPAVFGPWMNVSGSVLANYWQKKGLPADSTQGTKE